MRKFLPLPTQEQVRDKYEYRDGKLFYRHGARRGKATGSPDSRGYLQSRINNKVYMTHRLIWVYHHGDIPEGLTVDHINQDKADNRIQNLRLIANQQQQYNRPKRKDNKTGIVGVSYYKPTNKWRASIQIATSQGRKNISKYFKDKQQAIAYRKELEREYQKITPYS